MSKDARTDSKQQTGLKVKTLLNEEGSSSASSQLVLTGSCTCDEKKKPSKGYRTPGIDPRFQQQNQTHRCSVMYTDFHHCEHLLGQGNEACTWFKEVFMSICPMSWVETWDQYREEGRYPWHRNSRFPEGPYGREE